MHAERMCASIIVFVVLWLTEKNNPRQPWSTDLLVHCNSVPVCAVTMAREALGANTVRDGLTALLTIRHNYWRYGETHVKPNTAGCFIAASAILLTSIIGSSVSRSGSSHGL